MSEIGLVHRPALFFAPLRSPDGTLVVEPLPEGRLVQALASGDSDPPAVAERLQSIAGGTPHAVRLHAPGQWFIVSDAPLVPGELQRLAQAVGDGIALIDQSHGRVRLAIEGPKARHVLSKGTGIDLADAMFAVGASAQTLFGHIGIHVTRVAPNRFELIVLRSLAKSLWDELAEAGAPYLMVSAPRP